MNNVNDEKLVQFYTFDNFMPGRRKTIFFEDVNKLFKKVFFHRNVNKKLYPFGRWIPLKKKLDSAPDFSIMNFEIIKSEKDDGFEIGENYSESIKNYLNYKLTQVTKINLDKFMAYK